MFVNDLEARFHYHGMGIDHNALSDGDQAVSMRGMSVIGGSVALLTTFGMLRWAWLGFFTSLAGVMIVAIIAHGSGTAVAMVLDLSRRTVRTVCLRVVIAALCALLSWFVIFTLFQSWPRLFYVHRLGLVAASAIAYGLCAALTIRLEPAWWRYGGPLALVALAAVSILVMSMSP